jgi:chromosome segregation ATPase
MRTIQLFTVIAALIFMGTSCVEKTGKYQSLAAERDSLQLQAQTIEANYNETIGILNEVEEGFAQIREAESKMLLDVKNIEGNNISKREQLAFQVSQIKDMLAQNKARIEQLQRQSTARGRDNTSLNQNIKRMETELEEKTAFIAALQAELEKKNIRIGELTASVGQLNTELDQLSEVSSKQEQMIQAQDADLNAVWYVVASSSELKDAQILSTNGLFRPRTVLDKDFDEAAFTKADKRNIKVVTTDSRRVRILTSHPIESYNLLTGDDKTITIEITNPALFWSISKYLVVQK